jgi:hypothetical protein
MIFYELLSLHLRSIKVQYYFLLLWTTYFFTFQFTYFASDIVVKLFLFYEP